MSKIGWRIYEGIERLVPHLEETIASAKIRINGPPLYGGTLFGIDDSRGPWLSGTEYWNSLSAWSTTYDAKFGGKGSASLTALPEEEGGGLVFQGNLSFHGIADRNLESYVGKCGCMSQPLRLGERKQLGENTKILIRCKNLEESPRRYKFVIKSYPNRGDWFLGPESGTFHGVEFEAKSSCWEEHVFSVEDLKLMNNFIYEGGDVNLGEVMAFGLHVLGEEGSFGIALQNVWIEK